MQSSNLLLALPSELRRLIYAHVISGSSCYPGFGCGHLEPMKCAFKHFRVVSKSEDQSNSKTSQPLSSRRPFWPPPNVSTALLSVNRSIHDEFEVFLSHNYTPRLIFSTLPNAPNEWVQSLRIDIAAELIMDDGDEAGSPCCCVCRINCVNDLTTIETRLLALTEWFPSLCKLEIYWYPHDTHFIEGDRLPVFVISLNLRDKLPHTESRRRSPPRQIIADLNPAPKYYEATDSEESDIFGSTALVYDWVRQFHKSWSHAWVLDEVAAGNLSPTADGDESTTTPSSST